jgi:hypothetical protein
VTISKDVSKFGSSSAYFNGGCLYLPNISLDDYYFTIDFQCYPTVSATSESYLFNYGYQGIYGPIAIGAWSSGIRTVISSNGGASANLDTAGTAYGSIPINTWTHVALVRNYDKIYLFINGIKVKEYNFGTTLLPANLPVTIGASANTAKTGSYRPFTGYIDEVHIIKGSAEWISDFTPPTQPYNLVPNATTLSVTAGDMQASLLWSAVDNAANYNVYRSTTSGGPYTKIATGVTGTTYNDTDVINGTTYYYVVTAVNSSGTESAYSNEVSATPKATGKALLRITMTNGEEKEYDMSTDQMRSFVKWYNNGTDKQVYTIKKTFNIGKLSDRTEYLLHNKIAFFETMAYNTTSTATTTTTSKTALLKVVLSTGDVKEYEVNADQLSSFNTWYSNGGSSSPTFVINQDYNLGPFTNRSEYLVFNEISDFEVLNY